MIIGEDVSTCVPPEFHCGKRLRNVMGSRGWMAGRFLKWAALDLAEVLRLPGAMALGGGWGGTEEPGVPPGFASLNCWTLPPGTSGLGQHCPAGMSPKDGTILDLYNVVPPATSGYCVLEICLMAIKWNFTSYYI